MVFKKLIAVVTALTLNSGAVAEVTAGPAKNLISAAAASVEEEEKTYDIFRYTVTQAGKVKITGIDEEASGDIVIPDKIDKLPVDSVDYSIFYDENYNPSDRFTSVTVPDCLSSFSIQMMPDSIPVKPAADSEKYYVENGFMIAKEFNSDKDVILKAAEHLSGEVTIPEGVTRMGAGTILAENHDITVINVPSTLEYLGYVYDMPSLKAINVAEDNKTYFSYNGAIGRYAHLPRYEYDETTQKYKLNNNAVRKDILAVPEGYEGEFAVEDGVELAFQGEAFSALTKLTAVKLGKDTEFYGGFDGCTSLETVEIHGSAPYMNKYSLMGSKFYDDHEDGLLYSGDTLLGYKGAPEKGAKITVKDGTAFIADNAFAGLDISEINIPASVERIGANALDANGLTAVNVDAKNKNYSSADGVLFDKEGKMLKVYPKGKKEEHYIVPNGTEVIASMAFAGNSYLKHVDLPDSVEFISGTGEAMDGAFFDCTALEELVVPEKVKDMYWCEMYNCKLKVLDLPASVSAYGQIPYMAVREIYRDENGNAEWCQIDWNNNSYGSGAECEKIIFRNPQCDIANVSDTIIVGYKGSTAEIYAKENSLTAETLDGEATTEPAVTTTAVPVTTATTSFDTALPTNITEEPETTTAKPTKTTAAPTTTTTAKPTTTTAAPTTTTTAKPTTTTAKPTTTTAKPTTTTAEPTTTVPAMTTASENPDSRFVGKWERYRFEIGGTPFQSVTTILELNSDGTGKDDNTYVEWTVLNDILYVSYCMEKPVHIAKYEYVDGELQWRGTMEGEINGELIADPDIDDWLIYYRRIDSPEQSTTAEPTTTTAEPATTEAPSTATEPAETQPVSTEPAEKTLPEDIGDVDGNDVVDSSDASEVLLIYANVSTGGEMTEEQKNTADINRDGLVDSADASLILEYYAYVSTGGTDAADVYFTKQQEIT